MSDSQSAAVETPVIEPPAAKPKKSHRERDKTRPKKQPPYAVIVHNDESHTFAYVIEVLRRVCGHPSPRAVELTAQVHFTGRAMVWSGALEVAELKRDQIRGFGTDFHAPQPVTFPLGVTIEPLPGD